MKLQREISAERGHTRRKLNSSELWKKWNSTDKGEGEIEELLNI